MIYLSGSLVEDAVENPVASSFGVGASEEASGGVFLSPINMHGSNYAEVSQASTVNIIFMHTYTHTPSLSNTHSHTHTHAHTHTHTHTHAHTHTHTPRFS